MYASNNVNISILSFKYESMVWDVIIKLIHPNYSNWYKYANTAQSVNNNMYISINIRQHDHMG